MSSSSKRIYALHCWVRLELNGELGSQDEQETVSVSQVLAVASRIKLSQAVKYSDFANPELGEWGEFLRFLRPIRPDIADILLEPPESHKDDERVVHALEALLWAAVCASENKTDHIAIIVRMDDELAAELQFVVQEQQSKVESMTPDATASAVKADPTQHDSTDLNQKEDVVKSLASLREEVTSLQNELEASQSREMDTARLLQEAKKSSLDEEMKVIESSLHAQKKEAEINATVARQRQELQDLTEAVALKDAQLREAHDRLDVAAESEEKLAMASVQISKYRGKIEELSDVQAQLAKEQEARSSHVEKVLALEAQVATIPTLKKQIDDYKRRLTSSDVEMRELRKELGRRSQKESELEAHHQSLCFETEARQQHAVALQQELAAAANCVDGDSSSSACLTELNPDVVEKLTRLERENKALRASLDEGSLDNVRKLENQVDDATRLAQSYEEKLDATEASLEEAQQKVASLTSQLEKVTVAEATLRAEHKEALAAHARTTNELETRIQEDSEAAVQSLAVASARASASSWLQRRVLERTVATHVSESADAAAKAEAAIASLTSQLATESASLEASRSQVADVSTQLHALKDVLDQKEKHFTTRLSELEASHETTLKALREEGAEALANYQRSHAVSNKEHEAALAGKDHEILVSAALLKESEASVGELEAKLRKAMREKKFLSDELQEANVSGGNGGGSAAVFAELQALQKQYADLSERFKNKQQVEQQQQQQTSSGSARNPYGGMTAGARPTNPSVQHNGSMASGRGLSDAVAAYERRATQLDDEKRELVMKCTAAVAEREQAMQEVKALTKELTSCKEKATALELEKERAIRRYHQYQQRPLSCTPPTKTGAQVLPTATQSSVNKENSALLSQTPFASSMSPEAAVDNDTPPAEQCTQS